jgi:hypothetical protein
MMKNIARRTVYGWALWRHIENQRLTISTNQMERWHLRDMHQRSKVSYLTRWLASHVATRTRKADVKVQSTWIDQYPQAHSYFQATAGAKNSPVSVELADLLLIVKVQDLGGAVFSERAVLLQAKCANHPDLLDVSHAGSSTHDERNLLEGCCAPIRVTSAAGRASPPINSARADYDLGASAAQLGLKSYARYLLIPRVEYPKKLPYMTIWPSGLTAHSGSVAHFSEMMLAMTGMMGGGSFAGAIVNTSAAKTGWDHLVTDLRDYCNAQPPLNRFKNKTNLTFPRHVECSYDAATFHPFRTIVSSFLRKVFQGSWLERSLQLQMMPDSAGKIPPLSSEDDMQDSPIGGFTLLQVTITTSEPLKPHD